MLGVFASSGTTEAYINETRSEKIAADLWIRAALVGIVTLVTLGFIFLIISDAPTDPTLNDIPFFYGPRFVPGSAVGGLITFLISQTRHHRSREVENRRLANELTTFRPFIVEVSTEYSEQLINEATLRYYPDQQSAAERDV